MISRRIPKSPKANAWSRLLSEQRATAAPLLDLTEANPTRVGLSPEITAWGAGGSSTSYDPHPRGALPAREAIARYYADRNVTISNDAIVLTASTSEAYAHLFRMLGNPGDRLLVPRPGYPLFEPIAQLESLALDTYDLRYDGAWHLDEGSLHAGLANGAKAVVLVQPNHPTGTCLSADELAIVEAACAHQGAALICDEVFGDFAWGDASFTSLLAGPRRVPTFVLSGLSKVCGLPQLKLSWIAVAGPDAETQRVLEALEWIADLFLSVSTPVQQALPALLADRHAFQRRTLERIAVNAARLDQAIQRQPALSRLAAQGGWVAVLRVPRTRSEEDWALELLRRHVVVHPGHFYDFVDEAYLVLSLIVPPDVFDRGVQQIEALCSGIG